METTFHLSGFNIAEPSPTRLEGMETKDFTLKDKSQVRSPTRLEGMETRGGCSGLGASKPSPTRLEGMETGRPSKLLPTHKAGLRPALRGWKLTNFVVERYREEGLRPALRGWKPPKQASPFQSTTSLRPALRGWKL